MTSDTFRTIRKAVLTGFKAEALRKGAVFSRRSGFDRWKASRPVEGHWLRIDEPPAEQGILEEEELVRDRARQLLKRYGIVVRELLANELPSLQWRAVFRSLRLMELSGEILSGYFFEGLAGPQFISQEAFRLLQQLDSGAVFWLNAADPASLCGLPLASPHGLPPRVPSTHLVYRGNRLVIVSRRLGKSLDIFTGPGDQRLGEYLGLFRELLIREFNPVRRITVETVNGEPVLRSSYLEALKKSGFRSSRNALELWKEY